MEDSNILYHITEGQADLICKHYGKDYRKLEEYEICELLDSYIDEIQLSLDAKNSMM